MSKLSIISDKDMVSLLLKVGFIQIRQTGSHKFLYHNDGRATVVPAHGKDLKRGLIKGILKDIKMSNEEYEKIKKEL
jgi:predicted RNA binding protein YcfA (HicA-like mRNA interferase family)